MEIIKVITKAEIVATKQNWLQSLNDKKAQIEHLQKEILALDGACQAADVFINIIENSQPHSEE